MHGARAALFEPDILVPKSFLHAHLAFAVPMNKVLFDGYIVQGRFGDVVGARFRPITRLTAAS